MWNWSAPFRPAGTASHTCSPGGPPARHHRPGVRGRLFCRLGQPVRHAGSSHFGQGSAVYFSSVAGSDLSIPPPRLMAWWKGPTDNSRMHCGPDCAGWTGRSIFRGPVGTPGRPQGGLGGVISGAGAWQPASPSWPIPGHAGLAATGPRTSPAAVAGRLPTRPLQGEQLGSYCPPQLFKAELVYIKVGASNPPLQPLYEGACVADGGKSSKLIVCKSPGINIENPGDTLCCIIRQSYLSCHCFKS
jgi:hypothetical protein